MRNTTVNRIAGAAILLISVVFATPSDAATRLTDHEITFRVTAAIGQDPRTLNTDIGVVTHDGIVTLSGEVDSLAARNFADMETKKIRGVKGVINELKVEPANRSDEVIRDAVNRRLSESPVIGSKDLYADSVDGAVFLTGRVDSWAEREEAALLATEVAGVKRVTNDIVVEWFAGRTDEEIRNDVKAALARDVYLTGVPISVAVEDGVVTLKGSVVNLYQIDRAGSDTRWIRDVARVVNELSVDWAHESDAIAPRPVLSDAALEVRARAELDQDWRLDPTGITIDAHMGAITLGGTVYSRDERRIAEADVSDVVGVAWVKNRIFVQVDARDDRIIQNDVRFRLDTDYATADLGITATVHHGVVTLRGETVSWFDRARAADLAAGVAGVKEVDNRIEIAPSSWKLDADLANTIRSKLTWNWTTWRVHDDIGVAVHNGVVTLTGAVKTWAQRFEATDVALKAPGVWKVDNRLTVDGYNYPWEEYYYKGPYEYGLYDAK